MDEDALLTAVVDLRDEVYRQADELQRMADLLSQYVVMVETVTAQLAPALDQLQSSPIWRMMGGKTKKG